VVVTERVTESRKANRVVRSWTRRWKRHKYGEGPWRRPARKGYPEGVDYPPAVGSNPTRSIWSGVTAYPANGTHSVAATWIVVSNRRGSQVASFRHSRQYGTVPQARYGAFAS